MFLQAKQNVFGGFARKDMSIPQLSFTAAQEQTAQFVILGDILPFQNMRFIIT